MGESKPSDSPFPNDLADENGRPTHPLWREPADDSEQFPSRASEIIRSSGMLAQDLWPWRFTYSALADDLFAETEANNSDVMALLALDMHGLECRGAFRREGFEKARRLKERLALFGRDQTHVLARGGSTMVLHDTTPWAEAKSARDGVVRCLQYLDDNSGLAVPTETAATPFTVEYLALNYPDVLLAADGQIIECGWAGVGSDDALLKQATADAIVQTARAIRRVIGLYGPLSVGEVVKSANAWLRDQERASVAIPAAGGDEAGGGKAEEAGDAPPPGQARLRKEAGTWAMLYGKERKPGLPDRTGMAELAYLLAHPYEEVKPEKIGDRIAGRGEQSAPDQTTYADGDLQDAEEHLREVEKELEQAKGNKDEGNQIRLEEEKARLIGILQRAKSGRILEVPKGQTKERRRVREALKRCGEDVAGQWPELGRHLRKWLDESAAAYRPPMSNGNAAD